MTERMWSIVENKLVCCSGVPDPRYRDGVAKLECSFKTLGECLECPAYTVTCAEDKHNVMVKLYKHP